VVEAEESIRMARVLIVDDDRLLAETLRAMVADVAQFELGMRAAIEVVTSGREAARRLEAGRDEDAGEAAFDAIICDLSMPGVDGLTLYEGLVTRRSPLASRFVLVTGGAFTPAAADALASHTLPRLQKPFDADALGAILRPLLVRIS
jgi:CheY-like chemotaxis protein